MHHPAQQAIEQRARRNNTAGTHVPRLATEFCKLRGVGSIPTVSARRLLLFFAIFADFCCGVAELVQRPAVNGWITGSSPVATAILDMKRIGKRSVLKTDAPTGVAGSSPCHVRHFFGCSSSPFANTLEQQLERQLSRCGHYASLKRKRNWVGTNSWHHFCENHQSTHGRNIMFSLKRIKRRSKHVRAVVGTASCRFS